MVNYAAEPGVLSRDTARPWGDRIKEWRTDRGLSIDQMAHLINVSKATLIGWERNERQPHREDSVTERLRALQAAAGEVPGKDPKEWVLALWKSKMQDE
jgi:DNA-binding XRE family transcriptional regulator